MYICVVNIFIFVTVKLYLTIFLLFTANCFLFAQEHDSIYYEKGDMLLYYADQGDLESVKIVVEVSGADINYTDYYGVTALMFAAQMGHDSVVEYLVDKVADVNLKSLDFQFTALISAVKNDHLKTAELLIRNGANIDDIDVFGRTALHYATMYGFTETADMLMYYDADVNVADVTGYSPLCYAVQNDLEDIVMLLKLEGADAGIVLRDSSDLFHLAASHGNINFLNTFKNDIVLRKNIYGLTPVEVSLAEGQLEVLSWFLENGYELSDTINEVYTPRTLARISGNKETRRFIRKLKIKDYHYPYFGRLSMGFDMIFNGDDFFMTFNAGIAEDRYGFNFETGIMFRGGERRIMYPFDVNSYYQLRERRNAWFTLLNKNFRLFKTGKSSYLSAFCGLRMSYYWGEYDGLIRQVTRQMIASPLAGLALNSGREFRLFFMCDYLDLPIYNTNALFYSVGLKGLINIRKKETNEKYKYIIKY